MSYLELEVPGLESVASDVGVARAATRRCGCCPDGPLGVRTATGPNRAPPPRCASSGGFGGGMDGRARPEKEK